MKTRQGFVSNSSSSSFVLIGKKVPFSIVKPGKGKRFVAVGPSLSDGENVFEVQGPDRKIIEENGLQDVFAFYECVFFGEAGEVDISAWPKGRYAIVSGIVDQHSGVDDDWNIERMKENIR